MRPHGRPQSERHGSARAVGQLIADRYVAVAIVPEMDHATPGLEGVIELNGISTEVAVEVGLMMQRICRGTRLSSLLPR
jgi:hypothetical protein